MKKKKIKDLLIGSNNAGKVREIKQLLPKNIKISSIIDYKLKSPKIVVNARDGHVIIYMHLFVINLN